MNHLNRFLWVISLNFFLFGCNLGPSYVAPEVNVPVEWSQQHTQEFQENSMDCYRWWEALNDPMLSSLIERAACQNLDLHLAIGRVLEARMALKGGEASLYPHLDGTISYSYLNYNNKIINEILGNENSSKHSKQRHLNVFEVGFDAEWEIDLFGMNTHQILALNASIESVQEDFSNAWITLSAEIAKTYVELRGFQQKLAILDQEIEAQTDTQALTKSLITAGFIGSIDQFSVDQELIQLIAQKPQLEFFIYKSMHHLSILLGSLPRDLVCELSHVATLPELPCFPSIGIPSELLRRRPDIRNAERDLAAATEQVGVAIAALFPRLSLTGFIGDLTTFCSGGGLAGFVGPQLLLPIFNSRLLQQDVCLNKIKAQEALFHYQKTVLEAFEETENSLAAYHYESEKKKSLEYLRRLSQDAYFNSLQLYEKGMKNYLDVQAIHRSFLAAENAVLQCRVDLLIHYIALYKSLGGGWETFPNDKSCCSLNMDP